MKSLPWELCIVTMAQLTWVSYELSLMTPSQGAVMALHQASGEQGEGTDQAEGGQEPPSSSGPGSPPHSSRSSLSSFSIRSSLPSGFWDQGPTEEWPEAGRQIQGLCLQNYSGIRGTRYTNPGSRDVTASLGKAAFWLTPKYFRRCLSCLHK